MVRLATASDAEQLVALNELFNGTGETTLEHVRADLLNNAQEVVVVDEAEGALTGFVCVQLKRSFCYDAYMAEITEVFVRPERRRKGAARAMIAFAEDYCAKKYSLQGFELLTGIDNHAARAVYEKLGYREDGELHLSKRLEGFTQPDELLRDGRE